MVDDLATRWTPEDLDVLEQTDVDLQATRVKGTRLADNEHVLHVHTETLRRRDGYENFSETLDVAMRVELAALIDGGETPFTRGDYDVAYTIPPEGWVADQQFPTTDLLDPAEVTVEDRTIYVTTVPVVHEMLTAYTDASDVTLSSVARDGVDRLLGLHG